MGAWGIRFAGATGAPFRARSWEWEAWEGAWLLRARRSGWRRGRTGTGSLTRQRPVAGAVGVVLTLAWGFDPIRVRVASLALRGWLAIVVHQYKYNVRLPAS